MTDPEKAGTAHDTGRLSSGVAGLDAVLLGGFVKNGLYILQGTPGAGKTILGNQICYNHAASGGRALYVTLLSEQHERLFSNLEQMSFFDGSKVAHEILYVSAFQLLERDGLAGLLTMLRREIVAHKAGVLVLDGLVAAEAYASTQLELKKFVHELQTLAAAADCTMFVLTSSGMSADASEVRPEHTMVDGIIALHDTEYGWRVERDVLVRKFRGSDHLRGRHALCITADGIKVWPRTESLRLPDERRPRDAARSRIASGVAGLDAMTCGGFPAGTSTVVIGKSGTGKTSLALHFISGCTPQAPGIFLGFYEAPEHLLARLAQFGPHFAALAETGAVHFLWYGEAEGLIDRVAWDLLQAVRAHGATRVVIDGLLGFEDMSVQPERLAAFYKAVAEHLRDLGVTSLCTAELREMAASVSPPPLNRLSAVAENLILLRHVEQAGQLQRSISVLKLRDSQFDQRSRGFEIGQGGIVLDEALDKMGGGIAELAGRPPDAAAPGA
jgi:circadian clock protein KaiC